MAKVILSNYVDLFIKVYGAKTLLNVDKAYDMIADAIAAYESTAEVNKFSSKYDWYMKDPTNNKLSAQEEAGRLLFNDPSKGNCAACHPSNGSKALFTDFSYDNLGVPGDTVNPDLGLGVTVKDVMEYGKFKVPTLRNVAVAPPYAHNSYFKTLKEIVHFYSTRDVATENWPAPEYPATVNTTELGNLGLLDAEENAIVAFMMTLTDGYAPPNPR